MCATPTGAGQEPASGPVPVTPAVVSRDADGRATIRAVRTTPLRIDGALEDALYRAVPPISGFVQVEPEVGVPSAERTEVWVAFDDDNLYVTFKNWESEPGRRVASDMRRDGNILFNADDVVNLFLDPFLDRRNGKAYSATQPPSKSPTA